MRIRCALIDHLRVSAVHFRLHYKPYVAILIAFAVVLGVAGLVKVAHNPTITEYRLERIELSTCENRLNCNCLCDLDKCFFKAGKRGKMKRIWKADQKLEIGDVVVMRDSGWFSTAKCIELNGVKLEKGFEKADVRD